MSSDTVGGGNLSASASGNSRLEFQKFILPTALQLEELRFYAKWKTGRIRLALDRGSLPLPEGTCIDFATSANSLDYRKWEEFGGLKDLAVRLSGDGTLRVRVCDCGKNGLCRILMERELTLSHEPQEIEIENLLALHGQTLGVEIEAVLDCSLQHMCWASNDPAVTALMQRSSDASVLQNFIFPDETRADRLYLYCKWPDQIPTLSRAGRLPLTSNKTVDFTTFFNAFSHRKWHALTGLSDLTLRLSGEGKVRVVVQTVFDTGRTVPLMNTTIDLSQDPANLELGNPSQFPGELTAIVITALDGDAALTSAAWATRQTARRDVRLAAVITTFKREIAAIAAARRFAQETIPRVSNGSMKLYIIDNGRSLPNLDLPKVELIPNRNLGGAGGFTRGLLEAVKTGEFTHALFMDDDASCEPESVWRTMALLAYAINPALSVSGAMLLADEPYLQYEKGASLNMEKRPRSIWQPQNANRDLRHVENVASNDQADEINYGAWWFFAFPLAEAKHLPFPFFVRGDDVDFSLINQLPVVTLNGVASWCENFGYKLNPSTEYLAWRSWLALSFMYQNPKGQKNAIRTAKSTAIQLGRRFDYASMHAVLDAMKHASHGPRLFADDPAPLAKLSAVKKRVDFSAVEPSALLNTVPLIHRPTKQRWKLASKASLGGHLLPRSAKRNTLSHSRIAWEAGRHSLVRADKVVFGQGRDHHVLQANAGSFLYLCAAVLFTYLRLRLARKKIAQRYRKEAISCRSRDYWQKELFENVS